MLRDSKAIVLAGARAPRFGVPFKNHKDMETDTHTQRRTQNPAENTARVRERTGLDAAMTALSAARLARIFAKAYLGRPGPGARKPISPGRTPVPGWTGPSGGWGAGRKVRCANTEPRSGRHALTISGSWTPGS